ncbi:MAG: YbaN family protein [Bryobacterales bacterium]|nr:YbaN family protein [Bryobacterales bacterium]MDE0621473.1 YbaN family protein [Bryobacterales bacterium]
MLQVAGLRRWLFLALGGFFVGLGSVGVVLPGIPTTPFLLLASYFFVRSSPALHRRLLRSKLFGPTLRDWQRHRGVKRRTKWISIGCCSLMIGLSIATGGLPWAGRVVIAAAGAYGMWFVARLPTVPNDVDGPGAPGQSAARRMQ